MIKVRDLHFAYKKGEDVLKGLDFEVKAGEIFGLLGPSGAGKSTLQKVFLGLNKNYKGSVKVMNQEVMRLGNAYYNQIGVGFELPNLYEQLTIIENLKAFAGLYNKPAVIEDLLKEVGLYEERNKKVFEISKGMKMRLNYCRAQIGSPEILFLDEPTSGLDPNNTAVIRQSLLKYKESGKTVVLTTHNMTFAEQVCDKVAFIVEGQIKELDTPKHLKEKYSEEEVCIENKQGRYTFKLKDIGRNQAFLETLKASEVMKIETKTKSLEEIFTLVTGRVLV